MRIAGLQKMTLLDYPGKVACTVFLPGCNFRCPFCHNGGLVEGEIPEIMEDEELLQFLRKRKGLLDGVCITGGEPTMQPGLPALMAGIKELGYLVKLDTNGYRPEILKGLLDEGLLDYVAMDIKASGINYGRACGLSQPDITKIEESVEILKKCEIPYEFRTTVVKGIHDAQEFETIGKWLSGCRVYYLQAFRDSGAILGLHNYESFSKEEMEQMADLAGKYIDKVILRGVE